MTVRTMLSAAAVAIATAAGIVAVSSAPAHACSRQPYVGSVCMTGTYVCPEGYLPADGRLLQVKDYPALAGLYGTAFGGDGRATFGLPDLRGREAVGAGQGLTPDTPTKVELGQKRGAAIGVLSLAHMPSHTHAADFKGSYTPVTIDAHFQAVGGATSATSTVPSATTPYLAGSPAGAFMKKMWAPTAANPVNVAGFAVDVTATPANAGGAKVVNQSVGGGVQFTAIPPQLGLNACVAFGGVFPTPP